MKISNAESSRHRRPLSDTDVEYLACNEMPELTRQLRSVGDIVFRLQRLNAADPQSDLDGLHGIVDRELAPLVLVRGSHPAVVALKEFIQLYPDVRPPLLTKAAAIGLLA